MSERFVVVDGNEAAANVAYLSNEVIAIYPITPASPMGELSDAWAAQNRPNMWGVVPKVVQLQSEGGAAGAAHGSLQAGALTTTFTASQGLLLMLPNMFKIAGELTPTVFHIAARTLATHALSIFGDHSDVMSARTTGWAMIASASVQEAQDLALVATRATLQSRIPFLHFFDGFRTSHEVSKIQGVSAEQIRQFIDPQTVREHRDRALNPDRPVLRGSAQNPDVFFQAREAANRYYDVTPSIVQDAMDRFAQQLGRRYHLFDMVGAPDAERVVVMMGSGCGAAEEAVHQLVRQGEKVALMKVRLYRPFDSERFVQTLPSTVRAIAVLDRTKEPGGAGEPLYQDVLTALTEFGPARWSNGSMPLVRGGRYGLSSKEFTPAMAAGVLAKLRESNPINHFTVGIVDDVTRKSIDYDKSFSTEPDDVVRAVFYGLGSDGTVGANKSSVKIIGDETPLYAQGYFEYDSKKAGAITISHLRFGPRPIESTYKISLASFVACHQFNFLERIDVLEKAQPGATFLLNSPYGPDEVWEHVPVEIQKQIIDKKLAFYVIDAQKVASESGMGRRINTVMQTCFFAISNVLPKDEAIARIKDSIKKNYGARGQAVVDRNFAAVDATLAQLHQVKVPGAVSGQLRRLPPVPAEAPDFVQRVTARIIEGHGDLLPVSALPVDGTFPTATARFEKRSIAHEIPIWDESICIQCALCSLACPHAAIRMNVYEPAHLEGAPAGFQSMPWKSRELPDHLFTIQVAPDDCTGCGVCVDVCPAHSKEVVKHKSINMEPKGDHLDREREKFAFYGNIPYLPRDKFEVASVKGSQMCEPLFEYSGACAGCGETPYVKLLSQLFGDRALVANATGCSSIYGGNLPTTPWTVDKNGRGPAWSNSLFEDNAEFGMGMRLAIDKQRDFAHALLRELEPQLGTDLVQGLIHAPQDDDPGIEQQRRRVTALKDALRKLDDVRARDLLATADSLVKRSVWIVGGDGWAYDIGFGGLDHVLASGEDVNLLVLDTEVYSNTGGQASKSTQRGAVAKFAANGKDIAKKDLGMIAMAYGNVYVAQIAVGANPKQTVKIFQEAESWPGPSLIIAYSHCIAHGIDMSTAMTHQKEAVKSGYLTLYHYDPRQGHDGGHPFQLDSGKPTQPLREFLMKEARYAMLNRSDPDRSSKLVRAAQEDVDERRSYYEQLSEVGRNLPDLEPHVVVD